MKLYNCTLKHACEIMKEDKIILFGCGSWLKTINYSELMKLEDNFAYIVDNKPGGTVAIGTKSLEVYSPNKLKTEGKCIVILTSPVYMYEMYCQLDNMQLDDSIVCYSFPFMQMVSKPSIDTALLQKVTTCEYMKIPKIIHSFWFSDEKKPETYQKCVDTWHEYLGDYEIIEWNKRNYDCKDNLFFKKAIECGAWAFASDYARLDVLNEYGGIYLDMDVEVFQSFNRFLGNDAILSFSNNVQIDLAVLGSKPHNSIIGDLLHIYDDIEVPNQRNGFTKFFQPVLVKPTLGKYGIKMDGSLQKVESATVFPSDFFMPQDHILFNPFVKKDITICNHLDNFGWSFSGENKREKKIRDNRALWELIEN